MTDEETKHRLEMTKCRLQDALTELTANLMRITAGGGKSYELINQLIQAHSALLDYHAEAIKGPSYPTVVDQILRGAALADQSPKVWFQTAEEQIIESALRLVAARLVGPPVQESNASSKLSEGIRRIEIERKQRRTRRKTAIGIYDALDQQKAKAKENPPR